MYPEVKSLLLWHAAEEIEHKAVAYDVLQRVNSRYTVRVAGLAIATTLLLVWWAMAFRMLVEQEGMTVRDALADLRSTELDGRHPVAERVLRARVRYPSAGLPHHVIIVGEQHLRRILRKYLEYYRGSRTQLALNLRIPSRPQST